MEQNLATKTAVIIIYDRLLMAGLIFCLFWRTETAASERDYISFEIYIVANEINKMSDK